MTHQFYKVFPSSGTDGGPAQFSCSSTTQGKDITRDISPSDFSAAAYNEKSPSVLLALLTLPVKGIKSTNFAC